MAGSPTAEAEIHHPLCTESESEPKLHAAGPMRLIGGALMIAGVTLVALS
jgi:hypothetical protein